MEFSNWFKQNEALWANIQHQDRMKEMQNAIDAYLEKIEKLEQEYQNISWKDPERAAEIKNQIELYHQTIEKMENQMKRSQPEDIYDVGVRVVHPGLGAGTVITPPHERGASVQIKFDNGEVRYVDQGFIKPLPKHLQTAATR